MKLVVPFVLLTLATVADAQSTAPRPMLSEACRTEITTLCPKTGDRSARRQCLMSNREKLSTGCKQELVAMRGVRKEYRGGSAGDMAAPGAMTTSPLPTSPLPK